MDRWLETWYTVEMDYDNRHVLQEHARRKKAVQESWQRPPCEHVYLAQAVGTNLYKIGKSVDPHKRIKQYEAGCPYKIKLIRVVAVTDQTTWEQRIHQSLQAYHHHGEWFELPKERLQALIRGLSILRKQEKAKLVCIRKQG